MALSACCLIGTDITVVLAPIVHLAFRPRHVVSSTLTYTLSNNAPWRFMYSLKLCTRYAKLGNASVSLDVRCYVALCGILVLILLPADATEANKRALTCNITR